MNDNVSETTQDRSVGTLLRDLSHDITHLLRSEVELARSEMSEKTNQVATGLIGIVAAVVVAHAALLILLQALVVALGNVMPAWLASVIVGVVLAIIAFAMFKKGQNDLKPKNLGPRRTAENVQKDAELARKHS